MSLFTVIRLLANRLREGHAQTQGGNTRASSSTSESGIQCIVERAERITFHAPSHSELGLASYMREQQLDIPPVEARQMPFGTDIEFSDGLTDRRILDCTVCGTRQQFDKTGVI